MSKPPRKNTIKNHLFVQVGGYKSNFNNWFTQSKISHASAKSLQMDLNEKRLVARLNFKMEKSFVCSSEKDKS